MRHAPRGGRRSARRSRDYCPRTPRSCCTTRPPTRSPRSGTRSGREPGDPSLLGELDELSASWPDVYGPYPKTLPDGRRLSSVSAVIRADDGKPAYVLCVNVDRSAFEEASRLLAAFAAPVAGQPRVLFEHDWSETLNEIVGGFVREHGVTVERLSDRPQLLAGWTRPASSASAGRAGRCPRPADLPVRALSTARPDPEGAECRPCLTSGWRPISRAGSSAPAIT